MSQGHAFWGEEDDKENEETQEDLQNFGDQDDHLWPLPPMAQHDCIEDTTPGVGTRERGGFSSSNDLTLPLLWNLEESS